MMHLMVRACSHGAKETQPGPLMIIFYEVRWDHRCFGVHSAPRFYRFRIRYIPKGTRLPNPSASVTTDNRDYLNPSEPL